MVGLALEVGIKATMQSHLYQLAGKVYLQSDGGPIGLELSGALARVVMLLWDRELMRKLLKAANNTPWDLYMYMRYIDDGNYVAEEAPMGMRYVRGKFIIKPELVEEDREIPGDQRTAELVAKVANSIYTFVKVEPDFPSKHPDNLMPILDLKVGIEDGKLTWRYYRKSMANFLVLMERSAMSARQKRVSLTQEVVRILRNTKRDLPESVKTDFLSEFSLRMKLSGYSARFRMEVIKSGMICYDRQLAREEAGQCPLYRPKGYKKAERKKKKLVSRRGWYKPFSTVLFCAPSPGSELAGKLRKVVEEETKGKGWSVKVIERAGIKLQHQVPGLKEPDSCSKDDCFIHTTGGKGDCRKEGLVYKGTCLTCEEKGPSSEVDRDGNVVRIAGPRGRVKSLYWGESAGNGYTRGGQHAEAIAKPMQHQENAFVRHREDCHEGEEEEVRFRMDVVRFYSKAMYRQIGEGCLIQSSEADLLMNGKLDHFGGEDGGFHSSAEWQEESSEYWLSQRYFSARLLTHIDTHI